MQEIWTVSSRNRICKITNKTEKRCSTLLAIREIQIKTQWDNSTHPPEWLTLKRLSLGSIGEDMEQEGVMYTVVAKVHVTTLETETTD